MKKLAYIMSLLTLILFATGSAGNNTINKSVQDNEKLDEQSSMLVENIMNKEYDKAKKDYNYSLVMSFLTNETLLGTINKSLKAAYGDYIIIYGVDGKESKSGYNSSVHVAFEKKCIDINISFNNFGKISGIHYAPNSDNPLDYGGKPILVPEGIIEEEITFGLDEFPISGTLSYTPDMAPPFKVVVLVHGSGPNNRDESVGAQAPFRDIAYGLNKQGIAVLRYDKRTYTHGSKIDSINITPYEESVEDAVLAREYLTTLNNIDKDNIYILGHSLGAMLIPEIAQHTDAKGYIMMAAAITPMHELMVYQYDYIFRLDGKLSIIEYINLFMVKRAAKRIDKLDENSTDKPSKLLSIGPKYWLYLKNYDIISTAKKIKQPLLVTQGESDYQVPLSEFETIKDGLENMDNASFISYKGLSHLYSAASDTPGPEDYNLENHVDQKVIDDIAEFIN